MIRMGCGFESRLRHDLRFTLPPVQRTLMRVMLIAGLLISQVHNSAASEVLTEAKVLEVDRSSLTKLREPLPDNFITNVPESVKRSTSAHPR